MRNRLRDIALAAWLAVLGAAAAPALAQGLTPVKIGMPGDSIAFAPYMVAQSDGFFARNGLDAQFVFLVGNALPAALESNGIQATPLVGEVTFGNIAGYKIRPIGLLMSKAPYMIVARRTITTMQDLKGKVIATSPPKGTPNALLAYFLARAGIDGGKDVSLLYIGSESARRTLVLTGQADAIIEDAKGGYELEEKLDSLHTLVPPSQMPPQLIVGLCTSDALIQSDPDMLRRMLRALAQANAFMRDNPGPTIALLATRLKTSHDVASRMTADVIPSLTSRLVPPRELFTAEAALDSASPGRAVTAAALEAIWDVALAREVDAERAAP